MTHRTHSNELALTVLNDAFQRDPAAIHALICNSVPCNAAMAESPHVYVEARPATKSQVITAISLVNSILLAYDIPLVRFNFARDETGVIRFAGFISMPPQPDDVLTDEAILAKEMVEPPTVMVIKKHELSENNRRYMQDNLHLEERVNEFVVGAMRTAYNNASEEDKADYDEEELGADDTLTGIFISMGAVIGQPVHVICDDIP